MSLRLILIVSLCALASSANTARDDYGGSDKPVVEHSSSSSSSSSSYSSGTSGPSSNNNNIYYYYYPIDKVKDQGYQGSPSTNYQSVVSSGSSPDDQSQGPAKANSNDQDLSYSPSSMTSYDGTPLSPEYGASSGSFPSSSQNYPSSGSFSPTYQGDSSRPAFPTGQSSNLIPNYQPNEDSSSYNQQGLPSQFNPNVDTGDYPSVVNHLGGAGQGYGGQQLPGGNSYGKQPNYGNYPQPSAPNASYEPAPSGYRRYGITSIIAPMLALVGLGLLIPTVSTIGQMSGRRRRSIDAKDSAIVTYIDRIDRYASLCKAALEREECMNRIICELGDAMSTVKGKSTIFAIVEKIAPTYMNGKLGVLKTGALSAENAKCKKYTCQRKK